MKRDILSGYENRIVYLAGQKGHVTSRAGEWCLRAGWFWAECIHYSDLRERAKNCVSNILRRFAFWTIASAKIPSLSCKIISIHPSSRTVFGWRHLQSFTHTSLSLTRYVLDLGLANDHVV